jgi:DNA-binding MarR family transcriptional regulator
MSGLESGSLFLGKIIDFLENFVIILVSRLTNWIGDISMNKDRMNSLTVAFIQSAKLHQNAMHTLLRDKQVYRGQPPLLFTLSERDGQSQKELAENMRIKPATLTIMLQRTEKNGLIERKADANDLRVTRVFITTKGREALEDVKHAEKVMERVCFGNFSSEEKDHFRQLLLKMHQNLEDKTHTGDFT